MQDGGPDMEDANDALPDLPEEYSWLEGGQSYVACAFYTSNYLPQIMALKESLDKFGINYYLKRYERAATWEATTRLKPVFVNHCMERFKDKSVLYLDADAVVRQPLSFIDNLETDLSMAFHPFKVGRTHYLRISAGALFVRNNENGRRFAALWKDGEKNCGPLSLDEDMIYMAYDKLGGTSITVLPPTYYKIFDRPGVEPVLEHFQASRQQFKWRRVIRRARRAGLIVGAVGIVVLAWWLSQHLVWMP